ncbi:alpha/beta hydrolase [Paractinoplanes abujensis]|uniref:Alpha-L-fucosidase 2 n=1 Tax=Paractinoplanes abujensis TaxID=882441 RepID=A0A7W7G1L4_9ACTN|nr:glycoside hydrolase family 95 protein [Actinoplanes abujensis]MBB4692260.1 alpha-L-fucosidase 2 [Actinoplanes abujensis]GID24260.1 alpha/beta hydrolase [Actinoplanes abujensis]
MTALGDDASTTLRYRTPATEWTQALPLGNGRLGAMCFGGVVEDRFQLNENTCWSGTPQSAYGSRTVTGGPELVEAARAALARGDVRAAEEALRGLQGGNSQAFQPLADLWITQAVAAEPTVYQRHLDLRSAVASHTWSGPGGRVSQEAWIGPQALVIRRRLPGPSRLRVRLTSPHPTATAGRAGDTLVLTVRMPSDVPAEPEPVAYGPGSVTAVVGLRVLGAAGAGPEEFDIGDELILVLAAVTDYIDAFTPPHGPIAQRLQARLDDVTAVLRQTDGYATLRAAHEREHRRLFSRAGVRLGPPEAVARLDTTARLRAHAAGAADPALAALQFQYGRYLLIAASRPGGLPAGLQGLWNDMVRPPWNACYTTNINLEMNYWPALITNLAECHRPLLDWLTQASVRGAEVARTLYGLPGWTLHHNSDAWCFARPAGVGQDEVRWSFWPLAAAWLVRHAWEHHEYTGDPAYLPLLDGAAAFCRAWLREMPDGSLGTSPSTSPENAYVAPDGRPAGAGVSATADLVLIRALLAADPAASRIPPERVGADGRLAEWSTDVTDAEPGHRHTSHLAGLFPGCSVDPDDTPDLAAAARRTLDARGLDSTGWALAWRIALRARLRDAAAAHAAVRRFLRPAADSAGVYENLFCAHPPFQIDGNSGFTAGVAEMLLQSHRDEIHLLPCLPAAWADGAFTGLRARGGVTVDTVWSAGVPTEVCLVSDRDRAVTVRFGERRTEVELRAGVPHRFQPD